MEAENNSDEQEPRPPPSLPDSFPTSDDEINDSLWSLLTDTNFDISVIGEDQEPEPEPPTHPSLQESRKHFCLKLFIVDIKVTNVSFVLLKMSSKQSCADHNSPANPVRHRQQQSPTTQSVTTCTEFCDHV